MLTFIFNKITTAIHVVQEGMPDVYGHVAGGPPQHEGTAIDGTSYHARLHYNFNLEDPRLGVHGAPIQWLPLYWTPNIFNGEFKYRVVSDSQIEVLSVSETTETDQPYVEELPESPATLVDYPYDPTRPKDAYQFAGVFGIDKLSKGHRAKVLKRIRADYVEDDSDFEVDETTPENALLYILGESPFCQGVPRDACPNPSCPNHSFDEFETLDYRGISSLLFMLRPDADSEPELYQELAGGDDGSLMFQICKDCWSVSARNSCT
jgi:hypothetical protein